MSRTLLPSRSGRRNDSSSLASREADFIPFVTTPWPRSIECHQKGTDDARCSSSSLVRCGRDIGNGILALKKGRRPPWQGRERRLFVLSRLVRLLPEESRDVVLVDPAVGERLYLCGAVA